MNCGHGVEPVDCERCLWSSGLRPQTINALFNPKPSFGPGVKTLRALAVMSRRPSCMPGIGRAGEADILGLLARNGLTPTWLPDRSWQTRPHTEDHFAKAFPGERRPE